ncbi:outer membrane protein OmpK [Microbulbifer sp. HZ11]|uniref:outer membrane protein OmpK n=1 Tax=Microbulbifer sp. HZ11 TaxID=1453501 RepID=UPI000689B493|nr:outer membrane protein OmpK [Microbulbifer sp. HZ11]
MALSLVALYLAPLLYCTTASAQQASPPKEDSGFFLWTDTSLSLLPYGTGFEIDPKEQSAFTLEHAHESKIGDLFMFIDAVDYHGEPEGADTATFYGEIGPRLSFGKLFNKEISCTLFERSLFEIKDVLLATQYERGEDPDLSEAALIGVGFDLDIHKAGLLGRLDKFNYVQLNLYGRAELTEGTESGINDAQLSMNASYPLQIGASKFLIDGYFDWVLGLGDEEWSYHLNPQITMDLGAAYDKPKKLFIGVELDLWWNKYQIPNSSGFDTNQQAISLLIKYHLF